MQLLSIMSTEQIRSILLEECPTCRLAAEIGNLDLAKVLRTIEDGNLFEIAMLISLIFDRHVDKISDKQLCTLLQLSLNKSKNIKKNFHAIVSNQNQLLLVEKTMDKTSKSADEILEAYVIELVSDAPEDLDGTMEWREDTLTFMLDALTEHKVKMTFLRNQKTELIQKLRETEQTSVQYARNTFGINIKVIHVFIIG